MSNLEVGQVLSLKMRYNNSGDISTTKHPYLIVDINKTLGVVEVAQIDSLEGKEHKAAFRSNKTILNSDPVETVLDKDSYVQMDNIFRLENCAELEQYRRQTDKLSPLKLDAVQNAYRRYHETHEIDENKNVYIDRNEILELNKEYSSEIR